MNRRSLAKVCAEAPTSSYSSTSKVVKPNHATPYAGTNSLKCLLVFRQRNKVVLNRALRGQMGDSPTRCVSKVE